MSDLIWKVALIGVLGVGAQWLAWRLNWPAIVLMSIAGILAGPVFGVLEPNADFGELLSPMIKVAVAIILFEGGLTLKFDEVRGHFASVRRFVIFGVPIGWALGALAAHYLAGLSWPVAALFAGILIVTGPTVIVPLLRQAKLKQRPASILRWEGIINDPIGALLAVFVFQLMALAEGGGGWPAMVAGFAVSSIVALVVGVGFGLGIAELFRRGYSAEYLKAPIIFCAVLACFALADYMQPEAGLLAVTAMGVAMANARLASIDELRHFKEGIAVLLISGVFVVLTATIEREMIAALDWRAAAFVAAILFLVRPLTVFLATIGADLSWREKALVAWIAPRGIVAAAVSGLFAVELTHIGVEEGALLAPLAFAVVFATVVAHGFTIRPLAKALDLVSARRPGVLIVGANAWSISLAETLKSLEAPVTIADANWRALRPARLAEIPTYFGEILSEASEHHLDLNRFGYLLAVTGNEAYNALVCTDLAPELGRSAMYQLGGATDENDRRALSFTVTGRRLF
ncbi:MAG: sodium:proton antiporter, partial [Pseudomonadota bacterium]